MATTLAPTTPTEPRLLARSLDELEGVRDAWSAFTWSRVDANLDFLAELVACSPEEALPVRDWSRTTKRSRFRPGKRADEAVCAGLADPPPDVRFCDRY